MVFFTPHDGVRCCTNATRGTVAPYTFLALMRYQVIVSSPAILELCDSKRFLGKNGNHYIPLLRNSGFKQWDRNSETKSDQPGGPKNRFLVLLPLANLMTEEKTSFRNVVIL
jgi:hypothetical protein